MESLRHIARLLSIARTLARHDALFILERLQLAPVVVTLAKLGNCRVAGSRVEKVETFAADVISARACASLKDLISLSARFSTDATHWVLPKGRSAAQERDELDSQQRAMFHVEQSLTSRDAAILVGRGRPKGGSRQ